MDQNTLQPPFTVLIPSDLVAVTELSRKRLFQALGGPVEPAASDWNE